MVVVIVPVVVVAGRRTVADGRVAVVQLVWSGGEVLIDVTHGGRPGKQCESALSAWLQSVREAWTVNRQRWRDVKWGVVGGVGAGWVCVVVRGGKPQDECQGS